MMRNLENAIYKIPQGQPFSNKDLSGIGSYDNIRQVLSRFVKKGILTRVTRGVYVRPTTARFVGAVMPEASLVIKTLAAQTGETIASSGLAAANMLELTTQVPMKTTFITTGTSRVVKIGNNEVLLRHVSPRKMIALESKAGLALSALWYLGKANVNVATIGKIKAKLSPKEFMALCKVTPQMPGWMANVFCRYQQRLIC